MKTSALAIGCAFAALTALLVACSGRGEPSATVDESISECDQYVALMERCLGQLGPQARVVASRHAAITRDAIAAATKDAHDPIARDALRARCTAGTGSLAGSCR